MHVIEFEKFDITVAFVSRKHKDRLWFHRIWMRNGESMAKEVKEIQRCRVRWNTTGGPLEGRSSAVGKTKMLRAVLLRWTSSRAPLERNVQHCWFPESHFWALDAARPSAGGFAGRVQQFLMGLSLFLTLGFVLMHLSQPLDHWINVGDQCI